MSPVLNSIGKIASSIWARPNLVLKRANVLELNVYGELVEYKPKLNLLQRYLAKPPTCFSDLIFALKEAEEDEHIKACLVKIGYHNLGWGRTQELREAIISFRARGKKAFAFLEEAGSLEYFLACACDEIIVPPTQSLDLVGLLSEVIFFKGTLDKLEIKPEFFQAGKYKSAVEPYIRNSMSKEHREALEELLTSIYDELVKAIAQSRGIEKEKIKKIIDNAPYLAEEALSKKLIDKVLYLDQLEEHLEEIIGEPVRKISADYYYRLRTLARAGIENLRRTPRLALVYGTGIIHLDEESGFSQWDETLSAENMVKSLKTIRENKHIQAVIFRIDSPGGSGFASDLIWRELSLLAESKPLIVSMADVAASGGYYLAMPANHILAQPTTLTGSIGVIAGKINLRGLYHKLGMKKEQVKRGENADLYSDYSFLEGKKKTKIKKEVEFFYKDFVEKVAQARKLKKRELERSAQGRVWTGKQALSLKLIDEFGGLRRAIELAKEKIGLRAEERVLIEIYPRPPKKLFPSFPLRIPFLPIFSGDELRWLGQLAKLSRERILFLMPFLIKVR